MKRKNKPVPSWLVDAFRAANSQHVEDDDCPICRAMREHGASIETVTLPGGLEIGIVEITPES